MSDSFLRLFLAYKYVLACVMNFISDSYAVSLYPRATFVHKKSASSYLISHGPAPNPVLAKYRARGFTYVRPGKTYNELFEPFKRRRVGDKYCWMISLKPFDDHDDDFNPLLANTWSLIDNMRRPGFWMDCGIMRSLYLQESYCVTSRLLSSLCPDTSLW